MSLGSYVKEGQTKPAQQEGELLCYVMLVQN